MLKAEEDTAPTDNESRIATAAPDLVRQRAPNGTIVGHLVISDDDDPERVFERAPRRCKPSPREIWLFEIPTNPS